MAKNKTTIGKLIESEVRKQQIPITEFAKLICCQRNNVYDIFKRSKPQIRNRPHKMTQRSKR